MGTSFLLASLSALSSRRFNEVIASHNLIVFLDQPETPA